ncbi:alpha/beta hydrolase [Cellulophaga sp. F20128]|uniref:alpha/beta hydrolase n=1 Tax=Cellulophaga sp. F20128 TaxID=2926413 RepID=UPI001FF29ECF|nr:alpha/beta hydrolase [Cellulophaga sp. F20128]MCK0156893.1 alpha/beta hydrolase [Cellulophaga sp. F20128]
MKNKINLLYACLMFSMNGIAQNEIIPLWQGLVPNQKITKEVEQIVTKDIVIVSNVQKPTIEVYLPSKNNANGQAVLVFPGGGYGILAYDWEGTDIAKYLNSKGIAGIVVKYRLPNSKSLTERHTAPLQDAQRAMRLVRSNATKWNIDADKIGIIGFSAGGHLASTLGTHYKDTIYKSTDEIDKFSARPDFMALLYPVITFTDTVDMHKGSRNNLLGDLASNEKLNTYFSNELQVTEDTPPTFLVHATDDKAVPVENSLLFYKALKAKNVPVAMHIYPKGGHGFSLALRNKHLSLWSSQLTDWMATLE